MNSRIKELRKALKLTQKEFGARIGLCDSAITVWERSGKIPREKILFICQTFHVNQTWLETGDGEMFDGSTPNDSSDSGIPSIAPYEYALQQGFPPRLAELFSRLCELPKEKKEALDNALLPLLSNLEK